MAQRLKIEAVQPEALKTLLSLEGYLTKTSLTPQQKELIKIRASQINGCAYCVNMHIRDARNNGESQQRIDLICVWREAKNLFSEEEQLLFEITEEITFIHKHGLSDALYDKAIQIFGEEKTAQIIMTATIINAWNRVAISLHTPPDYKPTSVVN